MATLGEETRVAAGATGCVKRPAGFRRLEQRAHDRLLDRDDGVPGFVVARGPGSVSLARAGLRRPLTPAAAGFVVENRSHLGEPLLGVLVGTVIEAAYEGQAFHADQQLPQSHIA